MPQTIIVELSPIVAQFIDWNVMALIPQLPQHAAIDIRIFYTKQQGR